MRTLRRVVFYLCLAGYLVACPLLIFHALGYSPRPGAEPGVGKTGLLALESSPSGATVYLEGRRYTHRTPTVLSGLWPGRYHLKLVAKRYHPWSRWITIKAEKATVLDKLLLVPDQPFARQIAPGPYQSLTPVPEASMVVLTQGPSAERLVVYDWQAQRLQPLVTDPVLSKGRVASLHVSHGPRMLVRVSAGGNARMLWLEADRAPVRATDVTALFPEPAQWLGWDARHSQIFTLADTVNRLDVDRMAIFPDILPPVRGLDVGGQSLYVLGHDNVLRQHDRDGKPVHALSAEPAGRALWEATAGWCRISVLARDLVTVLGPQGQLWVSRVPTRWIATKITGLAFDEPRQRLLLWQKDRAGIVELSEDQFTTRWLTNGRDLQQAFWAHDGSHVLIRDGAAVLLLNVQTPDTAVPQPLVHVRPGSSIAYDEEAGGLFYLDRAGGALWYLNIVPRKNLAERMP